MLVKKDSLFKSSFVIGKKAFTTILLVLLISIVVIGVTAGVLSYVSLSSHEQQITSIFDSQTNDKTTDSALGLSLGLSLNSTIIQSGQTINVSAFVQNILSRSNNVTRASNWFLPNSEVRDNYSCPSSLQVQVFSGYYVLSNISSAGAPLQTDKPVFPPPECPTMQFNSYIFFPSNDVVALESGYNTTIGDHLQLAGYYDSASLQAFSKCTMSNYPQGTVVSPCSPGSPALFSAGQYTIAADDEWGQIVILHFLVTPSAS
jgi:hypothetical protein